MIKMSKKIKAGYIGQCDKIRMNLKFGEYAWSRMMDNATKISDLDFVSRCDVSIILDEGEEFNEFVQGDSDYGCYESSVDGLKCMFVQHSGFEFIFAGDDFKEALENGFIKKAA